MEVLKLIFGVYWAQMAFVLLGVGYLIKSFMERKSKKEEINHELYQQNKIEAVDRYYDAYNRIYIWSAERLYELRIGENLIFANMDQVTLGLIQEMKASADKLNMYFSGKDLGRFVNVSATCQGLCRTIRYQHYLYHKGLAKAEFDFKEMERCQYDAEMGIAEIGQFLQHHFQGK